MRELALFAGVGGGILGGKLLGWRTVCAVELNSYCARRLMQRQNEGHLPPFPVWDDVRTFDGHPWRGLVDVVSGGFPCQDISCAGKGAGLSGKQSGLWFEMARIISEVRPRFVFIENSPNLRTKGLTVVLANLAGMGYDAVWGIFSAKDVGAPHLRKRMWILAHDCDRIAQGLQKGLTSNTQSARQFDTRGSGDQFKLVECMLERNVSLAYKQPQTKRVWGTEPGILRVRPRLPARVDRIRALGNAQVPAVAALAWTWLYNELRKSTKKEGETKDGN